MEYEALLVRLMAVKRLGIKRLKIFGDSELVVRQVGIYGVKNPILAIAYRAAVKRIMEHFASIEYKVISKNENKLADSLTTLATKSVLRKENDTSSGEITWFGLG